MTATSGAPDPVAAAHERFQRIEDQLAALALRMRRESATAIAALDACLAGLDALRHHLAAQPWTAPIPDAPAAARTEPDAQQPSLRCARAEEGLARTGPL
ncbi:hypothetical protein ABZW03_21940 [Kitasatospora sp. NPDC004799]|uniref:hypothetical protein n=1 Tax=Kitasatospora sp. NPDC004799 TaxID=3154460 RepID=UPI0033A2649B